MVQNLSSGSILHQLHHLYQNNRLQVVDIIIPFCMKLWQRSLRWPSLFTFHYQSNIKHYFILTLFCKPSKSKPIQGLTQYWVNSWQNNMMKILPEDSIHLMKRFQLTDLQTLTKLLQSNKCSLLLTDTSCYVWQKRSKVWFKDHLLRIDRCTVP